MTRSYKSYLIFPITPVGRLLLAVNIEGIISLPYKLYYWIYWIGYFLSSDCEAFKFFILILVLS